MIKIGQDNAAKSVSSIFVGVNGIAKRVVNGFIGENNVAKRVYSANSDALMLTYKDSVGFTICGSGIIVDWGDGSEKWKVSAGNQQTANHTYSDNDTHIVIISGLIEYLKFTGEYGLISVLTPIPKNSISNFNTMFSNCTSLVSIPSGLFDNCVVRHVTSFTNTFHNCEALESIPAGLFDHFWGVESFSGCFSGCSSIHFIPEDLFLSNADFITSFDGCFSGCSTLRGIPAGLFAGCMEAFDFASCFRDCTSLYKIDRGLFDSCLNAGDITYCFAGCTNLIGFYELGDNYAFGGWDDSYEGGVSVDPFSSNQRLQSAYACFQNCYALNLVSNYFSHAQLLQSCDYCFAGCGGITDCLPELWEKDIYTILDGYSGCFIDCVNAENWDSVPQEWKTA